MTDIKWLADYLADASRHWLVSSLAGLLASSPMWITLCVYYSVKARGTRRRMNTAVVYGMIAISLLVACLAGLWVHGLLDAYATWFTAPLGPPLQIDTGAVDF